tara:strand:- start:280 stop:387 length:108 start_codon:yes stop_codon:yes gene_type:complete
MVLKFNASESSKAKDTSAKNKLTIKSLRKMMSVLD